MGCATSKQKVCRNCQASYSPVRRSFSVQVNHHHHHPAPRTEDTHHVVALTSSTLGSLNLDPIDDPIRSAGDKFPEDQSPARNGEIDGVEKKKYSKEEFAMGMIEAKAWSLMINDKIPKITPKTPTQTPPGEPVTINAWEMMAGLDISPIRPAAHHFHSFSFHFPSQATLSSLTTDDQPTPRVKDNRDPPSPRKPVWQDTNSTLNGTSIMEFDPNVIATFRKALDELPPTSPFHLEPSDVEKRTTVVPTNKVTPHGGERLIVYFTSLRGVRKTYEDCCHVRVILKGLGVRVDERDVSMDSGFKEELKELLGEGLVGIGLPRVFIGKRYIGGADDVRRLNEEGMLEKLVEVCKLVEDGGKGRNSNFCAACGDVRFLPCETCFGSCKIYYEEEGEFDECGFHRCPECNENGLVRCPICCN